ncbi:hypothetical protein TcBrA4_0068680 [Trypanosoma cruzi]|nr:hypothetical protein TcBrA4_0068680 [Trypanosoma cruzi]
MHIAVDLNAPFVACASGCALVLLRLVRVYLTAAESPGDLSCDADAVFLPVDVSCSPSDGSLSYRVCVWVWKKCSASAECENYTFSGLDVRMHGREGELGAVCHVASAVHTCSNRAASCARKEGGATVAFKMNVTRHEYAGPYELRWRQFPPDGTIHPPARSSDADRTGIRQLPPPREGRMTQNLVGQLHRK